jgi:DNA-binding transcriptional regulator YiaG
MEAGKVTISGFDNNKEQMRSLLHAFIEKKIQDYSQTKPINIMERDDESGGIPTVQYHASLWMICEIFELMSHREIAKQLDVSCELLKSWETEEIFSYLTKCNYREFLIYVTDLFA